MTARVSTIATVMAKVLSNLPKERLADLQSAFMEVVH